MRYISFQAMVFGLLLSSCMGSPNISRTSDLGFRTSQGFQHSIGVFKQDMMGLAHASGTGFIIAETSDYYVALTNAHVLKNFYHDMESVSLAFPMNEQQTQWVHFPVEKYLGEDGGPVVAEDDDSSSPTISSKWDFALVKVKKKPKEDVEFSLKALPIARKFPNPERSYVTQIIGYPSAVVRPGEISPSITQVVSRGATFQILDNTIYEPKTLISTATTKNGSSGSPILFKSEDGSWIVVGIIYGGQTSAETNTTIGSDKSVVGERDNNITLGLPIESFVEKLPNAVVWKEITPYDKDDFRTIKEIPTFSVTAKLSSIDGEMNWVIEAKNRMTHMDFSSLYANGISSRYLDDFKTSLQETEGMMSFATPVRRLGSPIVYFEYFSSDQDVYFSLCNQVVEKIAVMREGDTVDLNCSSRPDGTLMSGFAGEEDIHLLSETSK